MTIRPARVDDAAALVPLFEDWNHAQPEAVIAERLREWETTPLATVLVAECDGRLAGVADVHGGW